MRSVKLAIIIGICLGMPKLAHAQQPPATAPSTRPAMAAPDASTPKGTLTLLARALHAGDFSSARSLYLTTTPLEQKVADAFVERMESLTKFRQAIVKAFGEETATQMTGISDADAVAVEQRISAAEEKVDRLREKLEGLDIDAVSPRAALDLLYELKREAGTDR